ncbi:uncharacterized protein [Miscanthus floridulus]|uniref:uncharacterized protein n=1 Tax=Miscanthus floridulus TaxID=154761 RepID=UPI00345820C1
MRFSELHLEHPIEDLGFLGTPKAHPQLQGLTVVLLIQSEQGGMQDSGKTLNVQAVESSRGAGRGIGPVSPAGCQRPGGGGEAHLRTPAAWPKTARGPLATRAKAHGSVHGLARGGLMRSSRGTRRGRQRAVARAPRRRRGAGARADEEELGAVAPAWAEAGTTMVAGHGGGAAQVPVQGTAGAWASMGGGAVTTATVRSGPGHARLATAGCGRAGRRGRNTGTATGHDDGAEHAELGRVAVAVRNEPWAARAHAGRAGNGAARRSAGARGRAVLAARERRVG